jgi:hypothetical protein
MIPAGLVKRRGRLRPGIAHRRGASATLPAAPALSSRLRRPGPFAQPGMTSMKNIVLWLLGVPITVIILLNVFGFV